MVYKRAYPYDWARRAPTVAYHRADGSPDCCAGDVSYNCDRSAWRHYPDRCARRSLFPAHPASALPWWNTYNRRTVIKSPISEFHLNRWQTYLNWDYDVWNSANPCWSPCDSRDNAWQWTNKCQRVSTACPVQQRWLEQSAGHSYTAASHYDCSWLSTVFGIDPAANINSI